MLFNKIAFDKFFLQRETFWVIIPYWKARFGSPANKKAPHYGKPKIICLLL